MRLSAQQAEYTSTVFAHLFRDKYNNEAKHDEHGYQDRVRWKIAFYKVAQVLFDAHKYLTH